MRKLALNTFEVLTLVRVGWGQVEEAALHDSLYSHDVPHHVHLNLGCVVCTLIQMLQSGPIKPHLYAVTATTTMTLAILPFLSVFVNGDNQRLETAMQSDLLRGTASCILHIYLPWQNRHRSGSHRSKQLPDWLFWYFLCRTCKCTEKENLQAVDQICAPGARKFSRSLTLIASALWTTQAPWVFLILHFLWAISACVLDCRLLQDVTLTSCVSHSSRFSLLLTAFTRVGGVCRWIRQWYPLLPLGCWKIKHKRLSKLPSQLRIKPLNWVMEKLSWKVSLKQSSQLDNWPAFPCAHLSSWVKV